jgi:hypothetical protein
MDRTGGKREGRGSLGEMLTTLEMDSSGWIGEASGGQLVGLRMDGGARPPSRDGAPVAYRLG